MCKQNPTIQRWSLVQLKTGMSGLPMHSYICCGARQRNVDIFMIVSSLARLFFYFQKWLLIYFVIIDRNMLKCFKVNKD